MSKLSIKKIDVQGKTVLTRVDFNVPFSKENNKKITDITRIQAAIPTINYLRNNNAKIILISHAGRPNGKKNLDFSLKPISKKLSELLNTRVKFCNDCIGETVQNEIKNLKNGELLLLENLRFYKEETNNDAEFSKQLSKNIDIFVNDAFGTAHRSHASTQGVTQFVKTSAMGFLMENELKYLIDELKNPKKNFIVILGGAKVSDKIGVINSLIDKADTIIIGGAMSYTFDKALNRNIGNSLVENDKINLALEIISKAKKNNTKILLPSDSIISKEIKAGVPTKNSFPHDNDDNSGIPDGWMGLDIGVNTIKSFSEEIEKAKTIIWNGPMGVFEIEEFSNGTKQIAIAVAHATSKGAVSIVGGGDSVTAVKKFNLGDKITFISTGGGASLQLLEGKKLPGVEALDDA